MARRHFMFEEYIIIYKTDFFHMDFALSSHSVLIGILLFAERFQTSWNDKRIKYINENQSNK